MATILDLRKRVRESIWGRKLFLYTPSSAISGSTRKPQDLLAGPVAFQQETDTAGTTSLNFNAFGLSVISTESSGVHTLNPPIPGVEKVIYSSGGATGFVKTRNDETLESSRGTTFTVMRFVGAGYVRLMGLTTGRWVHMTETSAVAPAVTLSTST